MFAVCVSPTMVATAKSFRTGEYDIASVVGFPSGKHLSSIKAEEARLAVAAGADEIDMVIDVGSALEGDFDAVRADVAAVFDAIRRPRRLEGDRRVCRAACVWRRTATGRRVPDRRGRRCRFREDLHRISPKRGCVGARRRADGSALSETGWASRPAAASAPRPTRWRCWTRAPPVSGCPVPAPSSTGWTRDPRSRGLGCPSGSTRSGSKTGSPHRYP